MTSRPDIDNPGWEVIVESDSYWLHIPTGSWIRQLTTYHPISTQWEVYTGPMDGARFATRGMAMAAVEVVLGKGAA